MHNDSSKSSQHGFTILETMVALGTMLIVSAAVFTLVRDSMKVAVSTFELTDTQQNLRTAQEFVNRDLLNAGDGLRSIKNIRVPQAFVTNYLTLTPVTDPMTPGIINLAIVTSDNNVPANTAALSAAPADTVRTGTDRETMLETDSSFNAGSPVTLATSPASISATGSTITVPSTTIFTVGEIYFVTSTTGGTFGTITSIDATNKKLSFANGDTYGLNLTGAGGHINFISAGGTVACSLQRMKIIHYYVNSKGLLMRRVFGVKGAGFRESPVAEHIVNVQFSYSLWSPDASSGIVGPSTVAVLTTPDQQSGVRQVEVKITAETTHPLANGSLQQLTTTTSTSVRNMQFRRALQPALAP